MTINNYDLMRNPQFNLTPFVQPFSRLFDKGILSLDKVSEMAERDLKKIAEDPCLNSAVSQLVKGVSQNIKDASQDTNQVKADLRIKAKRFSPEPEYLALAQEIVKNSEYKSALNAFLFTPEQKLSSSDLIVQLKNDPKRTLSENFQPIKLLKALHVVVLNQQADRMDQKAVMLNQQTNQLNQELDDYFLTTKLIQTHRIKHLLQLSVDAKKHYYKTTFTGKIAYKIKSLKKALGFSCSIDRAEKAIKKCDATLVNYLNTYSKAKIEAKEFEEKLTLQSHIDIYRLLSMTQNKLIIIPLSSEGTRPPILIAKPNGDIYVTEKTIGSGSGRAVYKAKLYSPSSKDPKEVAIVSTLKQTSFITEEKLPEHVISMTAFNTAKMQEEQKQLEKLKTMNGIMKVRDHFPAHINGLDIMFAVTDLYPLGDLNQFLKSETGSNLTEKQKAHLTLSMLQIMDQIHQRNEVHRDINLKNILVKFDPKTEMYEPVFIDFESYISLNNKTRKKEISATVEFWTPEYIDAAMATAKEKNMFLEELSGSDKIASVTNPSMDIWALGLVFYRLWYGKDFITSLGYEETGKEKETICQGLLNVLPNRDKVFADKTDDVGQLIQSMLSMDPKKRPAAKDLLKA